jgi:hypothetical protein
MTSKQQQRWWWWQGNNNDKQPSASSSSSPSHMNWEIEEQRSMRKAVIITVCLLLVLWVGMKINSLMKHDQAVYRRFYIEAKNNKTAAEISEETCKKHPDFQHANLNCKTMATEHLDMDPEEVARQLANDHFWEQHFAMHPVLTGCHDGECPNLIPYIVATAVLLGLLYKCIRLYIDVYNAHTARIAVDRRVMNEAVHGDVWAAFQKTKDNLHRPSDLTDPTKRALLHQALGQLNAPVEKEPPTFVVDQGFLNSMADYGKPQQNISMFIPREHGQYRTMPAILPSTASVSLADHHHHHHHQETVNDSGDGLKQRRPFEFKRRSASPDLRRTVGPSFLSRV